MSDAQGDFRPYEEREYGRYFACMSRFYRCLVLCFIKIYMRLMGKNVFDRYTYPRDECWGRPTKKTLH